MLEYRMGLGEVQENIYGDKLSLISTPKQITTFEVL